MASSFLKYAAAGFGIAAFAGLLLFRYLFEGVHVYGSAMDPTFPDGAFVMSRRVFGTAERGDIVVIRNAPDGTPSLLSRVVALAGDMVEVRGEIISVNGLPILQANPETANTPTRDPDRSITSPTADVVKKIMIPADHVFVVADNRSTSHDSRTFGPVSIQEIDYKLVLQLPSRR